MISNSSYEMARSSSSFQTSKHQTPIKSPSPDQARMNALTPTQVKYIINGKNVKGYDLGIAYESCNQTPMRIQNQKEEYKRSRRSEKQSQVFKLKPQCGCYDHMKQLQKQVQILQIQNRNLLRKMAIQKQNQLTTSYPHQYCTQPRQGSNQQLTLPTSPSNVNLPSNIQLHRRGTSQIIDKIKQQYEQKINTLKLMVEQQVKQAIGVIEDMCQIFKNNLQKIEERIDSVQFKLKDVKIKRILQIQNYFSKSTRTDGHNKQLSSNLNAQIIVENSLSDILCVSIPQESQEQSKNYTTTICKLQQQIQLLRKAINQTSKSYNDQKSSLRQIINQKNEQINKLTHQLNKSQQIKQSFQWKYNKSIKEELILLQKNVEQIAQELISSETQCQNLTQFLDQKNKICENLQRQLVQLKDKMFNGEKHKVFLQQKVRYLQGNIGILQQELKQIKIQLNQAIISKMNLQKQRISKITKQTHRSSIQLNVLTLTSRIDKLLMLQQQRELKQKKAFFGNYMTMQSIQKSFKSKNNHRQYDESNQIVVEDFSKGDETMMRSQR